MKGLYVYGALIMALSFAVGVHADAPAVAALAIASAMLAGAGEAGRELNEHGIMPEWTFWPHALVVFGSWAMTAAAGVGAIYVLLV